MKKLLSEKWKWGPLPFNDGQFSFVSAIMVLHHVEKIDMMLSQISRVLKPGGYLVLREHDSTSEMDRLLIDMEHMIYDKIEDEYTDENKEAYVGDYRSKQEWIDLLAQYDLESVAQEDELLKNGRRSEDKPYYSLYRKK